MYLFPTRRIQHRDWSRQVRQSTGDRRLACLCGLFILALPCWAGANPGGTAGPEIWVDGPDAVQPGSNRRFPDVAVGPDGVSVYVWDALVSGSGNEIYLRRFDFEGNALADPVPVNSLTENDQTNPRVAVSEDGSFLVIWQSLEFDPKAGNNRRWVRSQAFNASAVPVGGEQLLSVESSDYGVDIHADVAALTGGGYVVVWARNNAAGNDTNRHIQARLVDSGGAPVASSFVANSRIGESETDPAVTQLQDGGFLVVWSAPEIFGRRFDSAGVGQTDDFQITTFEQGAENNPDAVMGIDGRVLVVWEDAEGAGDDFEIRARMYSDDLVALGDDFRVNTLITDVQRPVRAGPFGSQGFVVAWESEVSAGTDNDGRSIQGRTVTGNNEFGTAQFQVNAYEMGAQTDPAVGGMGEYVSITWRSLGNDAEPNDDVITGRSWLSCGIFCDGFEDL